ncbi:MAG: chromate transporter [Clostridia bacterium]|nr:chromate transporter [Clostridia bacterium]
MTYLLLFAEFFKTGLFAIGGGLATVPFLFEIANKYPWFTKSQLTDMIAVAESTPGPIGVNMATYAGYSAGGVLGAVIATIGLVMPSVIVVLIVAKILEKFKDNKFVGFAFYGIRPAVAGMILAAWISLFQMCVINSSYTGLKDLFYLKELIIFLCLTLLCLKTKINPICYIILGAIIGIVFKL